MELHAVTQYCRHTYIRPEAYHIFAGAQPRMHLQRDDSLLAAKGFTTALQFLFKVVVESVARKQQTVRRMQAEGLLRLGGDDPLTGHAAEMWRREHHGQLEVESGKKQSLKVTTGVSPIQQHRTATALLGCFGPMTNAFCPQ